jgi:tyrosine-protein phosphatase YwqE
MFSIFKKKVYPKTDLSALGCDMHSHLLPGIDDGSPDNDTSNKLIQGLTDLGYKKLITTPHIMWDLYKNDAQTIASAYRSLQLGPEKSAMPLHTAAEYYLDDHFDKFLLDNTPLLTIKDKLVLVEVSFVTVPVNFKQMLFNLQINGYQPILAHPERYLYFGDDKKKYDELREAGCLFQLNLLSLNGYYGKGPLELAEYLIKKKYVDLLGTDLHHDRHLHALQSSGQLNDQVKFLLDTCNILNPTLLD